MPKTMTRLQAERLQRRWRQDDLAYHSRLASSDVSKIESGRLRPTPGQLERLGRALGVDPSRLMDPADAQ
jgi:transcriptional regulator with XRE-family HTH domain